MEKQKLAKLAKGRGSAWKSKRKLVEMLAEALQKVSGS
jgi:hypothetical protein